MLQYSVLLVVLVLVAVVIFFLLFLHMLICQTVQFCWSKVKKPDWTNVQSLFGPTVQVLSTPWSDSILVLNAKVNCHPLDRTYNN